MQASKLAVESVHEELLSAAWLEPLALGGADERLWVDCSLAAFAENRLGDKTDPRTIDESRREAWKLRAAEGHEYWPRDRDPYQACYWILRDSRRVGTVALDRSSLGGFAVNLADLYVFPTDRGLGSAQSLLRSLRDALGRHGLCLRLSTKWTWQRPVRLYVRMGMWLRMWKRDLQFEWTTDRPDPQFRTEGQEARLTVNSGGDEVTLVSARRDRDRLIVDRPELDYESPDLDLSLHAWSTFALGLALHGWPLVRPGEWDQCYFSDAGAPEALAYNITVWEAYDRSQGWNVETPVIAGLEYPTWDEFQRRWQVDIDELEARMAARSQKS